MICAMFCGFALHFMGILNFDLPNNEEPCTFEFK